MKFEDQQFFNAITTKDIKDYLSELKSRLPQKSTKNNYQLPISYFNSFFEEYESLQFKLQKVADKMREHLFIAEPIKVLTMQNVDAGKFEMIDNLNCIYVNNNLRYHTLNQKIAILAHEMSHYYLMRKHNIVKPIERENELLTELNAVYCGFGLLLSQGYEVNETRELNKVTSTKVGYIKVKIIKRAIVETAFIRKQKPHWIVNNVHLLEKLSYYIQLRPLFKEYKRVKKSVYN